MEDFIVVWTILINICGKSMYIQRIQQWQFSWAETLYHAKVFSASFHRKNLLNLWCI